MKDELVHSLRANLQKYPQMYFLTSDLGFMAFEELFEEFPDRFINVGISEANMIGIASGLSRMGKKVVCYSMIPFVLMRCLEQIRVQLGIGKQDIKLIGVGAGYTYGAQGSSHHAFEDLGVARSIPGLHVYHPGTPQEVAISITASLDSPAPAYLRLGWPTVKFEHASRISDIKRPIVAHGGSSTRFVLATGAVLGQTMEAVASIEKSSAFTFQVLSCPRIVPFDSEYLVQQLKNATHVATVENNVLSGGFGEFIAGQLMLASLSPKYLPIHAPMEYFRVAGSKEQLEDMAGLSVSKIASRLRILCGENAHG